MEFWPSLELTDYEREYVRIYKTKDKPGVLNRVYKVVLNSPAQPTKNLPVEKLSGQIQIARRSRVYGLTFTGNIDRWRMQITNASGTLYTLPLPRSQRNPLVSTLLASSAYNVDSMGGIVPPLVPATASEGIGPGLQGNFGIFPFGFSVQQPFPLLIDPNWLLMPNETLIFNGTPVPISVTIDQTTFTPPLVLTVGIHVWEFPGMGMSSVANRETV
jgi:hypothetical protein